MTYKCDTCGTASTTAYISCQHPGCPDGHDQPIVIQGRAWRAAPGERDPIERDMFAWRMCGLITGCLFVMTITLGLLIAMSSQKPKPMYDKGCYVWSDGLRSCPRGV